MRSIIQRFWVSLLEKVNDRINQFLNRRKSTNLTVDASDDSVVNFFLMILQKVVNRSLSGAEYRVVSDSAVVEPLKELCQDLQERIYSIAGEMLGNSIHGECWVVPCFVAENGSQKLVHSYVSGDRICITRMREDGQISECYMVLNAVQRRDKTYLLCRKHTLDDNGNLTVSHFVADENAREVTADIPEWNSFTQAEYTYPSVGSIGFGRYKSPVNTYSGGTVYGVPLNYGCGIVEKQLKAAVEYIEKEMKLGEKKIFADPRMIRKNQARKEYTIDENVFPVFLGTGDTTRNMIMEYSPAIRGTEYEEHLNSLLERYQALMGVSELITHNKTTSGGTATEIKMLNIDNMTTEESIRRSIRRGNIETLEADAVYLGISRVDWEYDEEYGDIYADEQQELKNYIDLYNSGALELRDLVAYWFPTFTDEQIDEKVAALEEAKASNAHKSIEELLNV